MYNTHIADPAAILQLLQLWILYTVVEVKSLTHAMAYSKAKQVFLFLSLSWSARRFGADHDPPGTAVED